MTHRAQERIDHDAFRDLRERMVNSQLMSRGIVDQRVLHAMRTIAREVFVPTEWKASAYDDRALPIGHDQTISQPYIVAYMTELLRVEPRSRVLEIGTGTGYQTAVLATLGQHVYTIERIAALSEVAGLILRDLAVNNVSLRVGDGTLGWCEEQPFDRIMLTAGGPRVPGTLLDQLADGGILVAPIGSRHEQHIVRVTRRGPDFLQTQHLPCRFVKLVGQEGWEE